MRKYMIVCAMVFFFIAQTNFAVAEDYVTISHMDQLEWQILPNGAVYFRNLNVFNPAFIGCCYSYWIDTTTPGGKALWAVMLMKMATSERLTLSINSAAAGGALNMVGNY